MRGTLGIHLTDTAGAKLGDLEGRFALPRYRRLSDSLPTQPVEGRLDARVTDLSFAEAFSPQIDSLTGRLTSDVSVSGTVGAPRVVGALRLQDVAARFPLLGALFHDVQVTAQGDQQGAFSIDGRARSGPGRLAIKGSTPVRPTAAAPGRIRIEGDSFEVLHNEQAHALIAPAIDVTLVGDSVDVRGDFRVPYAHVELNDMPETAVAPSQDVVFVDDSARNAAAAQRLFAQVRIVLGDSVTFKGFNFTGRFGGELLVIQRPAQPLVGSGAIIIAEGHYQAYNQDLTITNGRIRFAGGPLDNPALDVRATRTAEDSTVAGLAFTGTLQQPEVTIFSDPPMSQDRALEYIVLGHARNDTAQAGPSSSLANKAVSAAGLRGGQLLAQNLGKGLGLHDATIKTSGGDPKSASLVAGTYLSPRLYVSYGFGLFDPNTQLRLRYLLSNRWTVQAESGEESGADLFYKIESGK
jgi:translocation and assembly module TamB